MKKQLLEKADFYLVTDSSLSRNGTLHDVRHAVEAGCMIVQYREKQKSTREMIEEAAELKVLCGDKAIFLVNDRVDVALAVDADGVHIGQDDMPLGLARKLLGTGKIIGVTVHDAVEAVAAEREDADYLGISPVFATGTKKDAGAACGVAGVTAVKKLATIPIVAIGGITKDNVVPVIKAGADIAVAISAVVCSDDVYREVVDFRKMIRTAKG